MNTNHHDNIEKKKKWFGIMEQSGTILKLNENWPCKWVQKKKRKEWERIKFLFNKKVNNTSNLLVFV